MAFLSLPWDGYNGASRSPGPRRATGRWHNAGPLRTARGGWRWLRVALRGRHLDVHLILLRFEGEVGRRFGIHQALALQHGLPDFFG